MARASAATLGVAAAAGGTYASLHTGATHRALVREIGFFNSTAVSSDVTLRRAANIPIATTSLLGQMHGSTDAVSTVNVDTAWSTAPTATAVAMRRIILPANVGAGIIWTFYDDPIVLEISSWLLLYNPLTSPTGSAPAVYFVWDE